MSSQAGSSLRWTCPDCGRDYRISSASEPPRVCQQCVRRRRKSRAKERKPTDAPASEIPASPTLAGVSVFVPVEADPLPVESAESPPSGGLPIEVESQIARQERQQLLRDVANISRTMTFFRRLVMGMVVMMVLNLILVGGALFYSMTALSGLGGGGNGAANLPGGGQAANPLQQLQEIQQNLGKMNEIIQDLEK